MWAIGYKKDFFEGGTSSCNNRETQCNNYASVTLGRFCTKFKYEANNFYHKRVSTLFTSYIPFGSLFAIFEAKSCLRFLRFGWPDGLPAGSRAADRGFPEARRLIDVTWVFILLPMRLWLPKFDPAVLKNVDNWLGVFENRSKREINTRTSDMTASSPEYFFNTPNNRWAARLGSKS